MKRIIALILALLLVSAVLFSCTKTVKKKKTAGTETQTTESGDPLSDNVPKDLRFDGYKYIMAFPGPADNGLDYQIIEDGTVTSKIDTAVYNRNLQIEERFGITLDGFTAGLSDTFVPELTALAMAGDDSFSVAMIPFTFSGIPWMTSKFALDWNTVDYVDLDREYWSQSMTENIAVNGHSFLIQGKINWTSAMSTQVCFFNTNVANDNKVENLYELVNAGGWTFEKLKTIAKPIAKDLNNDGTYDENDRYGIIQSYYGGAYNWTIAADCITVNSTDSGLEVNYKSEKLADIVEYCYDLLYRNGTSYVEKFDYVQDSKGAKIFFQDEALFMFTDLGHGDFFRNEQSDYGIIPTPKYNEDQPKYCTTNDQWGLSCAISNTASNPGRIGAITEALCALSAKLVYPTYYDEVLSVRNTRDEESKEMLNLIFSNIVYDAGITLAVHDVYIPLYKLLDPKSPSPDIASWAAKYSSKVQGQFDSLYAFVAANYS